MSAIAATTRAAAPPSPPPLAPPWVAHAAVRTGRLVGGHDTLAKIEKVPTDADDRPKEEVRIIDAVVFVNPYENVDAEM